MKTLRKIRIGSDSLPASAAVDVADVVRSGRLSYGPKSKAFESQFAADHDCRYGVFMNSGTSALHVALQALKIQGGWSDGDCVVVPATTFVATVNVVLHNNLKPIFVDVDPTTYTLDPVRLKMLSDIKWIRAVIPVHLCGLPADMDPILEVAKENSWKVIEDSCEAVLSTYKGKKVGSIGDVGCFSTYMAHHLTTGVGGMATTNDKDLAVLMRSLMNHGRDPDYQDIDLPGQPQNRFKFHHVGHSFRATEMEAALGVAQLPTLPAIVEQRKRNALDLLLKLQPLEEHLKLPRVPRDLTSSWMMFPIVCKRGFKDSLVSHLEERGIETRDLLPILGQPCYEGIEWSHCLEAFKLKANSFYIGCHQDLSGEDLEYVANAFKEFFA